MSSIASAYKLQIGKLQREINTLILENKELKKILTEGPIWGEGSWEDVIRDQSMPSAENSPQTPINYNPYSNLLNRGETSRKPSSAYSGSGNQSGGITPEQYTQHAYQVIMGIMQDAVDQGVIEAGSMSQLAGQAFATWVAGGPSALINFLNQNNIPFEQN
jgi:hypothetical protein